MHFSIFLLPLVSAFVHPHVSLPTTTTRKSVPTGLYFESSSDSSAGSDDKGSRNRKILKIGQDDASIIEEARSRFEKLLPPTPSPSYNSDREEKLSSTAPLIESIFLSSPSPPPVSHLSTIGRKRRTTEIKLLKSLSCQKDDRRDVVSSLWNLWYNERGPTAAFQLHSIDELLSKPEEWSNAESMLQDMIQDECFSEPLNRLATLYFLQGKYRESKKLCEQVLAQKPWHIGALNRIVMVSEKLNDVSGVRFWTERSFPQDDRKTVKSEAFHKCRSEWVSRAVSQAKRQLAAEEESLTESFRENMLNDLESNLPFSSKVGDQTGEVCEDAWQ